MARYTILALALLAGCAGTQGDDTLDTDDVGPAVTGCLEISESRLVFQDRDVLSEAPHESLSLTLTNACRGDVRMTLSVEGVSFSAHPDGLVELDAGTSRTVDVTFVPAEEGWFTGRLRFSGDFEGETAEIYLEGLGIASRLVVTPESHDFGETWVGCTHAVPLVLKNEGNRPMELTGAEAISRWEGFRVDADPIENGAFPWELGVYDHASAGPTRTVYGSWSPVQGGAQTAEFVVHGDDPAGGLAVPVQGTAVALGWETETFVVPDPFGLDVFIVVDRREPTRARLGDLQSALPDVMATLARRWPNLRVAITPAAGGCIPGTEPWLDPSWTADRIVTKAGTMLDLNSAREPDSHDGAGLAAGISGLTGAAVASGGCNEHFRQEAAHLAMVFVSDRGDASPGGWSTFVSEARALSSEPAGVSAHAVVGDYPSGCGTVGPGLGYYEATVAMAGRYISYCASDAFEKLVDIAPEVVANDRFVLEGHGVVGAFEVEVDGVPRTAGWELELSSNRIVFDEPLAPGTVVTVRYPIAPTLADCEG